MSVIFSSKPKRVASCCLLALLPATTAVADRSGAYALVEDYLNGTLEVPVREIAYDGPPITVRFSTHMAPSGGVIAEVAARAFERLEAESGGKLVGEIYWSGSAHGARDGFRAVRAGISDLSHCYVIYNPSGFEFAHATALPGIFSDALIGTLVVSEIYDEFLSDEFENQGVLLGRVDTTAPYNLISKPKIADFDDISGLSVRSGGGIQSEMLQTMGAVPVSVPISEAYTAFQRGTIDAVMQHDPSSVAFRTGELANYRLELNMGQVSTEYCVNGDFYAGLPEDLQGVFSDWMERWNISEAALFYDQSAATALDTLGEWGVETVQLDAAGKARRAAVIEEVAESFIADSDDPDVARQIVARMQELAQEYESTDVADLVRTRLTTPDSRLSAD